MCEEIALEKLTYQKLEPTFRKAEAYADVLLVLTLVKALTSTERSQILLNLC